MLAPDELEKPNQSSVIPTNSTKMTLGRKHAKIVDITATLRQPVAGLGVIAQPR